MARSMISAIETIRFRVHEIRDQFLDRFGQDLVVTDRLKTLLIGTAAVLVFSALLGLNSFVDGLESRYTRSQVGLERLKGQIESSSWEERQSQSQVLKSVLQDKLWTAQTPGLAEAGFERWLRDRLSQHKMEPRQLQIRRVPVTAQSSTDISQNPLAAVQKMTVKILMPLDQSGLIGFLEGVSTNNKTLVVERLIARSGRNPRIELDISAFYHAQGVSASGETR
jgi:hypothetical protein